MAEKKASGAAKSTRDSISKRLGVKRFGNQLVKAGEIIIRQRGTKFYPGKNTFLGKDFTIHSKIEGWVKFKTKRKIGFNQKARWIKIVEVEPKHPQ
ncbi:MAG: 50S ribosomal protein L27 [Patescibacteria group bacterium]|nr:50S ribosomal protein L27 [Patescibacteria group bacterium]